MTESTKNYLRMISRAQPEGPTAFLVRHGQEFPSIAPLPKQVKPGLKGQCFRNAFQLAIEHDLLYCEGYVNPLCRGNPILPLEHAWVVDKHGNVLEPTIRTEVVDYVGVVFRSAYIIEVAYRSEVYGILFSMEDDYRLLRGVDDLGKAIHDGGGLVLGQAHGGG